MYESLKNKLQEMIKAKMPEIESSVEDMEVAFYAPDGKKGCGKYKLQGKSYKTGFMVEGDEIILEDDMEEEGGEIENEETAKKPEDMETVKTEKQESEENTKEAQDESMNAKSNPEEQPKEEVENKKSEDSSNSADNKGEAEGQDLESEKQKPEATSEEAKPNEELDNQKSASDFETLVNEYGYLTALKIKEGTIYIK